MNYYKFLNFYNMKESNHSWSAFCEYRAIADSKGEKEAVNSFRVNC